MRIDKEKFTPEFTPPPPRYIVTLNMDVGEFELFRAMVGCDYTVSKTVYSDLKSKNHNELRRLLAQIYDEIVYLDKK